MSGPGDRPLVTFRPFEAEDVTRFAVQPSQRWDTGLTRGLATIEEGLDLVRRGRAWSGIGRDGRILGCAGFADLWPGRHAVAWAMLAEGIGAAHLAITRFARDRLAEMPHARVDAMVRADDDAEVLWPRLIGMKIDAVLEKYGATGGTHLLYARILR